VPSLLTIRSGQCLPCGQSGQGSAFLVDNQVRARPFYKQQISLRNNNKKPDKEKVHWKKTGRNLNCCFEFLFCRQAFPSVSYKMYARHQGLFFIIEIGKKL
jgi:hypothetical protein